MSAALPCPFCGCIDVAVIEGSTFRWRLAQCNGCGAQGPDVRIQTSGSGTKEKWEQSARDGALTEWNRRAPLDADLAAARALLPSGWSVRTNCDNEQRWLVITGPRGQAAAFGVPLDGVRAEVLRDFARDLDSALAGKDNNGL